jgi:hypothetical protein
LKGMPMGHILPILAHTITLRAPNPKYQVLW